MNNFERLHEELINEGSQPKGIKSIWDNGGKTIDRYTVFFKEYGNMALGLSDDPHNPMGFSNWGDAKEGKHLGKKINWNKLDKKVQMHIVLRMEEE